MDEVAKRRGHDHLTVVSEPGDGQTRRSRVLYVTEGKEAATVGRAKEWLESRGVPPEQITTVCADMSPAYAKGVGEHFPKAQLVFDCFHVVSGVSSAVDAVRRRERQSFPELLKGEDKLTGKQREHRRRLCQGKLQTGRAHGHLEALSRPDETEADPGRTGFAMVVRLGGPLCASPRW